MFEVTGDQIQSYNDEHHHVYSLPDTIWGEDIEEDEIDRACDSYGREYAGV
jgi:hypothetical protein